MRFNRVLPLLVVSLVGLGMLGSMAWSQKSPVPVQEKITKRIERMTKALDLTETQQKMMRIILEEKLPKIEALQTQMRELKKETETAVDGVLTEDQREKKAELKPDKSEFRRGSRMGRPGRGHFGESGLKGMLRGLDLTEDQKTQIKEVLKDKPENPREAIQNILTEEQKEQLKQKVLSQFQCDEFYIAEVPPVAAVQNGEGLIEFGFYAD